MSSWKKDSRIGFSNLLHYFTYFPHFYVTSLVRMFNSRKLRGRREEQAYRLYHLRGSDWRSSRPEVARIHRGSDMETHSLDRDTKGSMFLARLTLFLARRSNASRMNDEPWVDMARDFHRKRTGRGGWIVGTGGELVDPRPVLNVDRFNRLFTKW